LSSIITSLQHEFAISDLGDLHYFLGISVTCSPSGLFLSQSKDVQELLDRCHMSTTNYVSTLVDSKCKLSLTDSEPLYNAAEYRSIVGALQYLTFTRPDLAFAV
jgi:hypothetical protein